MPTWRGEERAMLKAVAGTGYVSDLLGPFDACASGHSPHRSIDMQTDPTLDPVADLANQPLDETEDQPRPLPGTLPRTDPLAPGVSPEDEEELGTDESLRPD